MEPDAGGQALPVVVNVLAFQPEIGPIVTVAQRRRHVGRLLEALATHCRQQPDIDLVLLPELTTVAYAPTAFENLAALAEPVAGETFAAVSAFARQAGCAVCYGYPEARHGRYYISQAVVGPGGDRLANYSKLHLAQFGASMEQAYFTRGDRLAIFELAGLRIGLVICYDFRFSGLMQQLVYGRQVDVLLHPVAFARDITFASWHPFAISRALEFQVYFLSVNRAGDQWGHSILCPPWIDEKVRPVTLGQAETACRFSVDRDVLHAVRAAIPFGRDRLANYGRLKTGEAGQAR